MPRAGNLSHWLSCAVSETREYDILSDLSSFEPDVVSISTASDGGTYFGRRRDVGAHTSELPSICRDAHVSAFCARASYSLGARAPAPEPTELLQLSSLE